MNPSRVCPHAVSACPVTRAETLGQRRPPTAAPRPASVVAPAGLVSSPQGLMLHRCHCLFWVAEGTFFPLAECRPQARPWHTGRPPPALGGGRPASAQPWSPRCHLLMPSLCCQPAQAAAPATKEALAVFRPLGPRALSRCLSSFQLLFWNEQSALAPSIPTCPRAAADGPSGGCSGGAWSPGPAPPPAL